MFFFNSLDSNFKQSDARPACQLASCGIRSVRIDADGESTNPEAVKRSFMTTPAGAKATLNKRAAKAGR
jgi:hypothetical protein